MRKLLIAATLFCFSYTSYSQKTFILTGGGVASTYGRVDSIRFVNNGLLHISPTAFALSGSTAVLTQTLANQSPYTFLMRASGSGMPSFQNIYYTAGALTDAATVTWDIPTSGLNDSVTLAGNRTLSITNAISGMFGVLVVKQDATGSRTLALPTNSKIINGSIILTTTANAKDILTWYYDGAYFYFNYGKNYN